MKERCDKELVLAAQNDDERALSEIFERYQKSLYYTAYKITNNKEDAQDALQETFLQVTRSIKNMRHPEYLKLWLNRIVAGKCRDIFRRNKTISMDTENDSFQYRYVEERTDFLPESQLHFDTDKAIVDYYIAQLPYAQREAIILTYFQHMTMQEIADLLDESVGTIKSRVHLAKKTLQKRLQAYENREDIKLNFKTSTLETILVTTLWSEYEQFVSPSFTAQRYHHSSVSIKGMLSFMCSGAVKLVLCTGLSMILATVGIAYYNDQTKQNESHREGTYSQGIMFQERLVPSEHHAYFLLMNWAMNEEQMKHKTAEEIATYRPLYEYLKQQNGAYYQALKERGFADVLETYF